MKRPRPIKLTEADIVRFWKKVDQCGPRDCWEWQAARLPFGYGRFRIGDFKYQAHRVAFTIIYGDIKLCILHDCNNPPCCNPKHLYAGTYEDNNRQCVVDGRHVQVDNCGEKCSTAKLTESDIRGIRRLYDSGWLQREIAEEYGIAQSHVSAICNGKRWKHI